MKLILSIIVLALFVGCGDDKKEPQNPGHPSLTKGYYFDTTTLEDSLFDNAINKDNELLKADCFKNEILTRHFTGARGLNNQQIYDKLSDHPMVVRLEMFDGDYQDNYINHVYGYEDDGVVYVNRFFVYEVDTAASLLLHEVLGHGNGFIHRSATDYKSIPYSLNDIYSVCSQVQNQEHLTCGRYH